MYSPINRPVKNLTNKADFPTPDAPASANRRKIADWRKPIDPLREKGNDNEYFFCLGRLSSDPLLALVVSYKNLPGHDDFLMGF